MRPERRPERVGAAAVPPRAAGLGEMLEEGIAQLGLEVDADAVPALLAYLTLLHKWNQVYNLTSVRAARDMLVVHLLDALSIVPLIDRHASGSLLDVGSGAGLPGIPLAIVRPALRVQSIDAVAKKVGFQQQVRTALALTNFAPVHGRIEAWTPGVPPSAIVSRAYADLARMLASIDRLADSKTTVIAMKGARPDAELEGLPPDWRVDEMVPLSVPFLGAARCAVVLKRRPA